MEETKRPAIGVALVGLGTVGSGVARLLAEFGQRTARHAGRPLVLRHVVVRDPAKTRQVKLPASIISTDL
ncbi:MAG TPA: homoserine dehydrogenase, partial [Pirellulales bacterium]|nr:homoserine dehydrogenase [Pirellulales bacterium]